jgi:hypothetical protein
MALKVASMKELKLQVLLEPERTKESIGEVCAPHGISRASFYRSPAVSGGGRGRARAASRRSRSRRRGAGAEPPAVSTIHRALKRNHLVAPQPPRRAKGTQRFERALANDLLADRRHPAQTRRRRAGLGDRLPGRPRPFPACRDRLHELQLKPRQTRSGSWR